MKTLGISKKQAQEAVRAAEIDQAFESIMKIHGMLYSGLGMMLVDSYDRSFKSILDLKFMQDADYGEE